MHEMQKHTHDNHRCASLAIALAGRRVHIIAEMRLLSKFLFSALVASSAARRSWRTINRHPFFVPPIVPRGGGGSEYKAVGVISGPMDATSAPFILQKALQHDDSCSVITMRGDSPKRSSLPKDSAMVETLSMSCHLLICTTPVPTESILKGAIRRDLAGYPKLKLIVILPSDATKDTREQLVLQDLKAFTPKHFDALEVVTIDEIAFTWNELAVDDNNESVLIDERGLIPLVKAIYESISNKPCNIQMEEVTQQSGSKHDSQSPVEIAPPILSQAQPQLEVMARESGPIQHDSQSPVEIAKSILSQAPPQRGEVAIQSGPNKHDSQLPVEIAQSILSQAQPQLDILEAKQDDVWLNTDKVPILEFGTEADAILQKASDTLCMWVPPVSDSVRNEILLRLSADLKRLYDAQLQSLREHYGRRYESVLDSAVDPAEWTQEAARVTEAFRAAAQHAIPKLCREEGELVDADFSYVRTLQGLITDMMEATSLREDLDAAVAPDDDGDEDGTSAPRAAKWYEKLAARAAVLGINYLQGWMAWQVIQRAALERDRDMPKFPLF